MKTLGVVMIAFGVLAIAMGIAGFGGSGIRSLPLVGVVLVAGGWVLYRHNKKKELANRG